MRSSISLIFLLQPRPAVAGSRSLDGVNLKFAVEGLNFSEKVAMTAVTEHTKKQAVY